MAYIPSGRQFELTHGAQKAAVVEVGGGLRAYTVAGHAILDGYRVDEMCSSGRGLSLIPWPNRLDGGVYEFDGQRHQVALSEPARGNAIHGLTRFANWELDEQDPSRVAMAYRLHPQPGYPFMLELTLAYRLDDDGLSVASTATNRGTARCPFGSGAHPYVKIDSGVIDRLVLRSPAQDVLITDDRGIPIDRVPLDGGPTDFRSARALGDTSLDTGFANLERGSDGRATVTLTDPESDRQVEVWMDEGYDYLMVFTGDTLGPDRRRRGLAVEPMTCAPNAFRSGDGLRVLEPGETFTATWGITTRGFA